MVSLGSPRTGEEEIAAVSSLLADGELSVGNTVEAFEDSFAEFSGTAGAAAVSSGSVALELALEVSDLEEGDAVVLSPFNCAAMLYSVLRQNMQPVFCDIQLEGYSLSPDALSETVQETAVNGLLLTHLYGQPCDLDEISQIAEEQDLTVINDFAQAVGATYDGRDIGTSGDIGVCSFGATKILTTAEGGAVVSDKQSHIDRVKKLRSNTNGDDETPLRSVRMNDLEAAIGIEQLKKFDNIVANKREAAQTYLDELPSDVVPPRTRPNRTNVYHGFPIRTPENRQLMAYLEDNGVETSIIYEEALYEYTLAPDVDTARFPNTETATDEVLLLPIHANLSREDIKTVIRNVREYFES
ncbi:DegT/DnrJ/EryC1/StrS family aminotransferase [Halorubrum sp. Atlit-8R]|uniref:DegT/DnrJ/EryC1/StrS family aminotransferase n=1 Tax=unclassified Halorubrum TaxID=2642239 RepID=UPI000EF1ED64|nr:MULTISPECIES: DegT/DnrJ/EryC1/StrS family aminotransferase [unclassified Halorubrum]RLM70759.1 DegT/DnrJ/EryC1/StrS family aminotransferase [Halorubrum sp. Atlit-9R]RLM71627.1 DegT/DnrJ/EryC1/StrS family aminotransferase [Halorubrum sp. Atlit-9R]RLM83088.1 DegT/DnrJ/EryC1/StrS family aminotransferase [Halorubrum sp. Atlit-8R]